MEVWPCRIRPTEINHVALRVRDLQRSAAFYCELFGLEVRPAVPPGDSVCVCAVPSASSLLSFGIALIQGLPGGTEPVGMDHLSLEVAKAEDVEDIYCAAVARGAEATEPRAYGGFYQTFIFDPDGYKIEIVSKEIPPESAACAVERRDEAVRLTRRGRDSRAVSSRYLATPKSSEQTSRPDRESPAGGSSSRNFNQ
jgi:catechol 2,3-dioxygenase-like lactoylglutathione lyase family enzyme